MPKYTIIYDDEELTACRVTREKLSGYINKGGYFERFKILEDFPGSGETAYDLWNSWPEKSILIFRDGSIYVPNKTSVEVTEQVEIWEVD